RRCRPSSPTRGSRSSPPPTRPSTTTRCSSRWWRTGVAERTAVVDRPDTRPERPTPRRHRGPLRALTGVLWRVVTDAWIQILAFLRQPRLLLVLVIGPFVVLALFGA